jgi:hypothetical protein
VTEPIDNGHGEEYDEGYTHTELALGRSSGDYNVHLQPITHTPHPPSLSIDGKTPHEVWHNTKPAEVI